MLLSEALPESPSEFVPAVTVSVRPENRTEDILRGVFLAYALDTIVVFDYGGQSKFEHPQDYSHLT
jgi:hypothetical protein